eukprot:jgi/Bigna1/135913/aug1.31_g10621
MASMKTSAPRRATIFLPDYTPAQSFLSVARYGAFIVGVFTGVYKSGKFEKIEAKLAEAKKSSGHGHSHGISQKYPFN